MLTKLSVMFWIPERMAETDGLMWQWRWRSGVEVLVVTRRMAGVVIVRALDGRMVTGEEVV